MTSILPTLELPLTRFAEPFQDSVTGESRVSAYIFPFLYDRLAAFAKGQQVSWATLLARCALYEFAKAHPKHAILAAYQIAGHNVSLCFVGDSQRNYSYCKEIIGQAVSREPGLNSVPIDALRPLACWDPEKGVQIRLYPPDYSDASTSPGVLAVDHSGHGLYLSDAVPQVMASRLRAAPGESPDFEFVPSEQKSKFSIGAINVDNVNAFCRVLDGVVAQTEIQTGSANENEEGGTGLEKEDTSSAEDITQPFDPSQIRIESKPMTIDLLLSRISEKALILTPDFQRKGGIWKEAAQSRLIESILIRIPLPAFYMDATDEDRWLVVDGLQRLTAINRFVNTGELALTGLEFLAQLANKHYKDLPRNLQRRILETQVTLYLIERGTPPSVKFNIFRRINTGGLPLSSQEIRHALNQGRSTRLLAELATTSEFKTATDNGVRDDRMGDREIILRFLAFALTSYQQYKGNDLDGFLNNSMEKINQMPDLEIVDLRRRFLRSMRAANSLFGRHAFRKRYKLNEARNPINKALFETWSVNLDKLSDKELEQLIDRKGIVNEFFIDLMQTQEFNDSVTVSTGDLRRLRYRFEAVEKLIRKVLA